MPQPETPSPGLFPHARRRLQHDNSTNNFLIVVLLGCVPLVGPLVAMAWAAQLVDHVRRGKPGLPAIGEETWPAGFRVVCAIASEVVLVWVPVLYFGRLAAAFLVVALVSGIESSSLVQGFVVSNPAASLAIVFGSFFAAGFVALAVGAAIWAVFTVPLRSAGRHELVPVLSLPRRVGEALGHRAAWTRLVVRAAALGLAWAGVCVIPFYGLVVSLCLPGPTALLLGLLVSDYDRTVAPEAGLEAAPAAAL